MALDDTIKGWLDRTGIDLDAAAALPLAAMREAMRRGHAMLEAPAPDLAETRGLEVPGPAGPMRARLYTPLAAGHAPGPGLLFIHGGGFMVCDIDTHDRLARRLAAASRARTLSIDYRLAPEHPFPAAVEDALAAYDWARGPGAEVCGFDPKRLAVAGDSAGGNLAAVIAQARRGADARPAFQLLIYPLLQMVEINRKGRKALQGGLMSTAILQRMREAYLPNESDAGDSRASPLLTQDLAGLAPAFIVTAGLDPLGDEGRAYADRLAAAGTPTRHRHYQRYPHGFFQFTAIIPAALAAIEEAGQAMAAALAR